MDYKFVLISLSLIFSYSHCRLQKLNSLQFLITVNATFVEPHGCIATARTPWIKAGQPYNRSQSVSVGNCDHGPITFNSFYNENDVENTVTVDITFYSSVILDASHPECQIKFNGSYLVPKADNPEMSLLPACFLMDSREGYHMTYYWFKIFDWSFS